jgi:hypothetical protein
MNKDYRQTHDHGKIYGYDTKNNGNLSELLRVVVTLTNHQNVENVAEAKKI